MSAPKQIAKRQKLERKRRRKNTAMRRRQRRQQAGGRSLGTLDPFPVAAGPIGGLKMSTVLEEFVEPWADTAEDYEAYSKLLSIALVAWNAALEPEDRREGFIRSMIDAAMKGASLSDRLTGRELIDQLVARKLRRFAWCRRPILGYHLDELEDGGLHLSVISAVC